MECCEKLKQTTLIFLQAIPHKNLENKIREKILQIKSVIDLHDVSLLEFGR